MQIVYDQVICDSYPTLQHYFMQYLYFTHFNNSFVNLAMLPFFLLSNV